MSGLVTTNQARTCATAVLQFFRTLGIHNQPVYLFVTDGIQGALSMAMHNNLNDAKTDEVCALLSPCVCIRTDNMS